MKLDPQGGGWGFFGWNVIKDLRDPPNEENDTGVLMFEEGGRRGIGQEGWKGGTWQQKGVIPGGLAVAGKGSLEILTPDSRIALQPLQGGEGAKEGAVESAAWEVFKPADSAGREGRDGDGGDFVGPGGRGGAGESVGREKEEGWAVKGDLLEEGGGAESGGGGIAGQEGGGGAAQQLLPMIQKWSDEVVVTEGELDA